MFKNYFKATLRNMRRYKGYSAINILGLAIGMAICIIILLFVQDELSYDTHHQYTDRIYRIHREWLGSDGSIRGQLCTLAPSFVPLLENEFPQLEHVVRMLSSGQTMVSIDTNQFIEERFYFAEDDIFEVLDFPLLAGNPKTALKQPNQVVLSQSMAHKYFGQENPLGKQLRVDDRLFQVTGIMRDVPRNSHLHVDFLASFISLKGRWTYYGTDEDFLYGSNNFTDNLCLTYVRLAAGADLETLYAKLPDFMDRHLGTRTDNEGNIRRASDYNRLIFMKVPDIHLHSHTSNEYGPNSDIRYVVVFTLIAAFILIIACINFINLSTARSMKRAKEVGMRKVVGASRRELVYQFLGESLIIAFLALIISIVFVYFTMPLFKQFSGRELNFFLFGSFSHLLILLGVFLFSGLVAGLYPAFYLSAFRPTAIFQQSRWTSGNLGSILRKILVVFQFAISIALIICVGIVYSQMHYMRNADLGFNTNNIVLLPADQVINQKWQDVKQALQQHPSIISVTASKRAPTGRLLDSPGFRAQVKGKPVASTFSMPHNRVDIDFFKTYGMEIIAGRDFSDKFPTDFSEAYIINETAVRRLGFDSPQESIGAPMEALGLSSYNVGRKGKIIGVVRDFHYESLHNAIVPVLTYVLPSTINTVALRLAPGNIEEIMADVQEIWDRYHPGYPLTYSFLDQRIAALYQNETRMMRMFGVFSILAIFIGCLGLFGLASFMAEQRTKEIGIRKVFGASIQKIIFLLSRDFSKWVLLGNILAWPVSYLTMKGWLENFAYRIPIGIHVFIFSALLTLIIALITVSYQSIKAAYTHPIDSLRYE